ncbi:MAG: radical SAM protein [Gemmatimonadota bacterium]
MPSAVDAIRSRRPAKRPVDPWRPLGHFWEEERSPRGGTVRALTVFLAGAECPFTCVFCDLWRHTLDGPTPRGAIPAQLERALGAEAHRPGPTVRAGLRRPAGDAEDADPGPGLAINPGLVIKLYNASNFFDPRAVPPEDEPRILELLDPFARVTVECHPRLVGERCLGFARRLRGRLEVAMGLETVHPDAFPRLHKGMELADFDRAAARLLRAGIGIRAFVLVGAPFVPPEESVEWAVRSTRYAFDRGAGRVSLIPVRGGNGAMEELAARGEWTRPTLEQLEEALERSLEAARAVMPAATATAAAGEGPTRSRRVVTADVWDAEAFASCRTCAGGRLERLGRMNLSGRLEPRRPCPSCGWGDR